MRKTKRFLPLASALLLAGCQTGGGPIDLEKISFGASDLVNPSFGGLGVEWGAYEDTDKLMEGAWDRIETAMDRLKPARVRLMINYDWFCYNFDDHDNTDKNDDTWSYNFTNKYAKNTFDCLDYCETRGIDVAFGAWNVIGTLPETNDVWGMMDDVSSDPRWAKISADVLDMLVNKKGYTCIKWFVSTNEPNWLGVAGSSKNHNNTFAKWEQGVKNVRAAFDKIGLSHIGIIGGDTTGFEGTQEYFTGIAKGLTDVVSDYGCHLYLSNIAIDRGTLYQKIIGMRDEIKKLDSGLLTERPADVWEAGLLDGKTTLDSQTSIATDSYAVRMVDYTVQCLAAGMNGIVYWDFDDAMHFMYMSDATYPKRWGMFSTLAEATSQEQELRPWYHSSTLLTHLFAKGNRILSPAQNDPELINSFRSLAAVSPDKTQAGFVAVNAGREAQTRTFLLTEQVSGDKLYIYNFGEGTYRLDENGFIAPNEIIDGSLNKKITVTVPKMSAIVVSNRRL